VEDFQSRHRRLPSSASDSPREIMSERRRNHLPHRRRAYRYDPELARLSDDELLNLRMCDLPVRIERTPLEDRLARLYHELELKKIPFRPHYWLSSEWFSPDGVPGIAIPFYLAHPRLIELEAHEMLDVEGATEEECLQILRHETAHAIDNAYRLSRRKRWQAVFGKVSLPYPEAYTPQPYSKEYVHHLDAWYAQSHPAEDFAETFAVWLKPRSGWRTQYDGWPVLRKLMCVDEMMQHVRDHRPRVRTRARIEPLHSLRQTLREHYAERRRHYGIDQPHFFDQHLRRLFATADACPRGRSAAAFLRQVRKRLRRDVAHWTGERQYTVDQVLGDMISRAAELKLRLARPPHDVERDALIVLTMHVMNYLNAGLHRIAL
jgi:hypothetical protein